MVFLESSESVKQSSVSTSVSLKLPQKYYIVMLLVCEVNVCMKSSVVGNNNSKNVAHSLDTLFAPSTNDAFAQANSHNCKHVSILIPNRNQGHLNQTTQQAQSFQI